MKQECLFRQETREPSPTRSKSFTATPMFAGSLARVRASWVWNLIRKRFSRESGNHMTLAKRNFYICVAVIWLAALAAYSNSFTISFQFDDTHTVQSNVF